MLKNLRLWAKITLAMVISVALVVVILTAANLSNLDDVINQAELAELDGHVRAVSQAVEMESRTAEALSHFVAALPVVQETFARQDREALSDLMLPTFQTMATAFNVEQFQFHLPPATSFLRLHKPGKYGDDLSSFRKTVVVANEYQDATRGLEGGVAGLGVRGVSPVFLKRQHLGSVEFGLSFGQDFFKSFRLRHGVDVGMHLVVDGKVQTYASTIGIEPLVTTDMVLKAFNGAPQISRVMVGDQPRAVYVSAIQDFSGKNVGVIEVSMDRTSYLQAYEKARNTAVLVGVIMIAVGLGLALLTARGLTHRIGALMVGVNEVSKGNLTVDIVADGGDELADLARAASEMRSQLHDLAVQVRSNAHAVHSAAQQITGAVEGQAATSSEMSSSVAEITSTMEELSASSTQIAEHSKSVVDIANSTYESSQRGTDAMQSVLVKMGDIQQDNQNSLREIVDLGNKSKEISKVMEIINAVADQTKLIAFNAALEAASAGDAGRRFGVVAAEIRRLADSVTESTGEIEHKISEIQDSISRLVITSEKGANGIDAGMDATGETADRLDELVEAARQTSSAAQQISLSTQQQKTASNQVVVALREIVTASSHTADSIQRITEISRDMNGLSANLDTLINRFQLRTESRD